MATSGIKKMPKSDHNGDAFKDADYRKIEKSKQKLEAILNDIQEDPLKRLSKITKHISKALQTAITLKENGYKPVTVDRRQKLVQWLCTKALYQLRRETMVKQPIARQPPLNREEEAKLQLERYRVCGDLCRYMAGSLSFYRSRNESSIKAEIRISKEEVWSVNAIQYYDTSDLSLAGYDVRIKHLLDLTTANGLLLLVLFNLRRLIQAIELERQYRLKPIPNRTVFLEESAMQLNSLPAADVLLKGFSHCALLIINQCKEVDAGFPIPEPVLLWKSLDRTHKAWSECKGEASKFEVEGIILGMTMLADLAQKILQLSPMPLSALIKAKPFVERLREIVLNDNSEATNNWSCPHYTYLFKTVKLEGVPIPAKIQRLNSRPAFF